MCVYVVCACVRASCKPDSFISAYAHMLACMYCTYVHIQSHSLTSPSTPLCSQVNVTETAKRESEAEHMRLTAALKHVMERYRVTEIKLRKDIRKAQ